MSFELPASTKAFQEKVRRIAATEIAPHAAETDRSESYPWHCVEVLKREGFMGMTIPVQYGGRGASYLDAVVLIEEMAKACTTTGRICVESNMGALGAIMKYGSEAQRKLAAGLVLAGDKPAICITEPEAGSAATEMTTRADRKGLSSMSREDTDVAIGIDRASISLTKPVRRMHLKAALQRLLMSVGAPPRTPPSRPVAKREPPERLRLEVLLVEDNPVNQEVTRGMLHLLGCREDLAENGREAVEAASKKRYDLILMDCQMPVMDGYAATRAIRKSESSHTPIVALTANAMAGDSDRCLSAGMDDYLSKPFSLQNLRIVLEKWLPEAVKGAERPAGEDGPDTAAPGGGTKPSPVDRKALDNIRALQAPGGPDLLSKVIGLYLSGTPKLLGDLRDAAVRRDADVLRTASHTLKSSSANLGASGLSSLCKELETREREGRLDGTADAVAGIEAENIRPPPAPQHSPLSADRRSSTAAPPVIMPRTSRGAL